MAIRTVPQISGPDYGGVIYGLNLNIGYSAEPSKLTLDIVSKNGQYRTPTLNRSETVRFSNFTFNGTVWSYSLKKSATESTLQVTLIDNSIILDRYYVLLWKRGLLNLYGDPQEKSRTFNFRGESVLAPIQELDNSGYPITVFKEVELGSVEMTSKSYAIGGTKIGNVILVGREKFANSACDIPDTYYTFDDLKAQMPVRNMRSAPNNKTWKATHEGTLREVLSSWCSDLGFDYYWDFSSNSLVFYSTSRGISTLPNSNASNIISKESSSSMEGTFKHYGIAYTAMPKAAVKTLSTSRSISVVSSISPYPISYFINKIGAPQPINSDKGRWGGNRSQDQFIHAAFLGFVSRSLRDLYCFQNSHWEALGYKIDSGINVNKNSILTALKKYNYGDMIATLEASDAKDLPNYQITFISRDKTVGDAWNDIEQKLLEYTGQYYRTADVPGSFFYCNANYTIEITISIDPEGQLQESGSEDFSGKRVVTRGGAGMSYDQTSAKEQLGYSELETDIQNCAPIHIDLIESGLLEPLLVSKILTPEMAKKINTLVIYPDSKEFVEKKIGFKSSLGRSNHPLEKTYYDIKNSNIDSGRVNCKEYEANLRKGSCQSLEEFARNIAIQNAGGNIDQTDPDELISGLLSTTARHCQITLLGGSVKIHASSDGNLQTICRYNMNINKISTLATDQFIWSVGNPGIANDVAEIRISNENVTNPEEDSYQSERRSELIRPADSESTTPKKDIKYVFAGNPQGVTLSPSRGLSSLDISLSSEGFITTATFSTKPPKPSKANNVVRYVHSQFNRASYNAS